MLRVDIRVMRQFGGNDDYRGGRKTDLGEILGLGDRLVTHNRV